jgi:hypothetical protein
LQRACEVIDMAIKAYPDFTLILGRVLSRMKSALMISDHSLTYI